MTKPRPGEAERCAPTLFGFEADLYPALRCIPMAVRYKLDLVGMKVSLKAWHRLPQEWRLELLHTWPVETEQDRFALRTALRHWLAAASAEPAREIAVGDDPPWENRVRVPAAVGAQGMRCRPPLNLGEWSGLTRLERFALVKLAQSQHERDRFSVAVAEFRCRRA